MQKRPVHRLIIKISMFKSIACKIIDSSIFCLDIIRIYHAEDQVFPIVAEECLKYITHLVLTLLLYTNLATNIQLAIQQQLSIRKPPKSSEGKEEVRSQYNIMPTSLKVLS